MHVEPTECQCDGPGYCPLMQRQMSAVRHDECKHKPHYFAMFLREAGKTRKKPSDSVKAAGLGDTVAKVLGWFGVKPCPPCQRRKRKLNRWFPYRRQ